MRTLIIGATFAALFVTPALAGSTTLSKGGKKMSLWCNGGGCYTAEKLSAFKKGPRKRIGPGGSSNFKKNVKRYKASGWK